MTTYPIPTISISPSNYTGLIGETVIADLLFSNTSSNSSDIGYGGCADVFVQVGLLSQSSAGYVATWTYELDVNSLPISGTGSWIADDLQVTSHPFAVSGLTLPSDPNGTTGNLNQYRWYVYSSTYSSYGPNQPIISLESLSLTLSSTDGIVIGSTYNIIAKPWFRYGANFLNGDPIVGQLTTATIDATLVRITKSNNLPESETAAGPNFPFSYTIRVDISQGVVVNDLTFTDTLSDNLLLYDPDPSNSASSLGSITDSTFHATITTNVINSRKNLTIPSLRTGPRQYIKWDFSYYNSGSYTGLGGNDMLFTYKVYAPYSNVLNGSPILTSNVNSTAAVSTTVAATYFYNTVSLQSQATNSLTIKQICIQKTVTSAVDPLIPLADLTYKMHIQISDFFAIENLTITDILSDGHYLSSVQQLNSNFTAIYKYSVYSYILAQSDLTFNDYSTITDSTDQNYLLNTTSGSNIGKRYQILMNLTDFIVASNLSESRSTNTSIAKGGLTSYGASTYLDPYTGSSPNFVSNNTGPCEFSIQYGATVDQLYYGRTASTSDIDASTNKLDIGDAIDSSINITGTLWDWAGQTTYSNAASDTSATYSGIGSASINKYIYGITRNGKPVDICFASSQYLQSQDLLTYRIVINLSHQNFLNMNISDYLPPPVISSANIITTFDTATPSSTLPALNTISYGPTHTFNKFKNPDSVAVAVGPNSFTVDYGSYQNPYIIPANIATSNNISSQIIDILYTVLVDDVPTVNGVELTNQGVYSLNSNIGTDTSGFDSTGILLDQPLLIISKGIVAFTNANSSYNGATFTTTPPITCQIGTPGFVGTVDLLNIASNPINSGVNALDRGSRVKYCVTIANTGSYTAFDVMVNDLSVGASGPIIIDTTTFEVRDGANNAISLSDSALVLATDFYSSKGISIGSIPAISGTSSVIMIFYEALVLYDSDITLNQVVTNTAGLTNYANMEGGESYSGAYLLQASVSCTFRNVTVSRNITYRSENPTNLVSRTTDSITIGEIYRITSIVTVPIGILPNFTIQDQLNNLTGSSDSGMELISTEITTSDTGFSNSFSSIITNAVLNDQYISYSIGNYNNTSTPTDKTFTIVQYLLATNNEYNSKYELGQSDYSNRLETSSTSLMNINANTLIATSNNVILNITEPKLSISKSFYPSKSTYSQGDQICYKIAIASTSQETGAGAQNVILTDTVPTTMSIINVGTTPTNASISSASTPLNYTIGSMASTQTLDYYVNCTLNSYRAGDSIINTAVVSYNSVDPTISYVPPSDDSTVSTLIASTTRVYRSYTKNATASFTTNPVLTHTLINYTYANDTSYSHPVINSTQTGAIGDTMITTATLSVPKGHTYLKNVSITFENTSNIIPNTSNITIDLPSGLTSSVSPSNQLVLTPVVSATHISFSISTDLSNTNGAFVSIEIPFAFQIKNTASNVKSVLTQLDWSLELQDTVQISNNTFSTINSSTGYIGYYIVEPFITITQTITQIPLSPTDNFEIDVNLTVDNSTYATTAFNASWHYDLSENLSSVANITVPSDWIFSASGSMYTFTYNGSANNGLNRNLSPGTSVDFVLQFTLNPSSDLTFGDSVTSNVTSIWTSQNSGSGVFILPTTNYEADAVRFYDNSTTDNTVNNYNSSNNISVVIEQALETLAFGLSFEDALDFDYDYNDLVTNTAYSIYRDKCGIKKIITDFHLVTRGAAYDHTLGVSLAGLRTLPNGSARSATWSVYTFNGTSGESVFNNAAILSYLNQSTTSSSSPNLSILREDAIPILISTRAAMPPDAINDTFSSNAYNRTSGNPSWISPASVRLIIEFSASNELITNGVYPIPYIDIRGPFNNKITPVYNDYEYRHYLGSTVDVSTRHFTYNDIPMTYTGFPKVLVTNIDYHGYEESGNLSGHYGISQVYTDFVNYVTNGLYPATTSMVDMTQLRSIVPLTNTNTYWCTNPSTVTSADLLQLNSSEGIQSKSLFNEYNTFNVLRMGTTLAGPGPQNSFYIGQIVPATASSLLIKTTSNDPGTALASYASSVVSSSQTISNVIVSQGVSDNVLYLLQSGQGSNTILASSNVGSVYGTEIFSATNILKIKPGINNILSIDTTMALSTTDSTHDVTSHNTSRIVCDYCYFQDTYILSIGATNDLIITTVDPSTNPTSNINTTLLPPLLMSIDASTTVIGVISTTNTVFLMDSQSNTVQIFEGLTIVSLNVNNNNVLGLTSDGTVYVCDISSGLTSLTSPVLLCSNVFNIASNDEWAVYVNLAGKLNVVATTEVAVPSIISSAVTSYNLPSINNYCFDVRVYNSTIIVCYN